MVRRKTVKGVPKKKKPAARSARRKTPRRQRRLTQQDDLFGAVFVLPMAGITLGAVSRF